MNAYQVMVSISINSSGVGAGVNGFNQGMNQIKQIATQTAQQSALSFNSIFGANFFADLASNAVRSFTTGFTQIVSQAVKAASAVESAFRGAESIGRNLGIDPTEVSGAIKNLDLVKKGLITVGDGATALKNLLASGFSLEKSVELIKRFGDTAAFGRQAALSFGYAISSATEGIKNQNSILVDNAGVTKNLSVILAERGFQIQDLSDKVKGAAAREALYQGLLKETSLQIGDSNTLLQTTQGRLLQVDAAYLRFLQSLGSVITESKLAGAAIGAFASILDFLGKNISIVVGLTAAVIALTAAMIILNTTALPTLISTLTTVVVSLESTIAVMLGLGTAAAGTAATVATFALGWAAVIAVAVGVGIAIYNAVNAQKELANITEQSIQANIKQIATLKEQHGTVDELTLKNTHLVDSQNNLSQAYSILSVDGKRRIDLLDTEAQKVSQLRVEIENLIASKNEEQQIFSRTNAANLAAIATEFAEADRAKQNIKDKIKLAEDYQKILAEGGDLSRGDFLKIGQSLPTVNDRQGRINTLNEGLLSLNNAFTEVTTSQDKLRQQAEPLIAKQTILNTELHNNTDAALDSASAHNLLSVGLDDAKKNVELLGGAMNTTTKIVDTATLSIRDQIDAINELADVSERNSARRKLIDKSFAEFAELGVGTNETPTQAAKRFQETLNPDVKGLIETEKRVNDAKKQVNELFFPKETRTPKAKKSFSESLGDSLEKLNKEVTSFRDLTSKDFKIRFQKEELERLKQDFEKIISLRRDLALPQDEQLPATAEGTRKEIESLEQVKRLRDDILKVRNEERDAQERLVVAQLTSAEKVVSAETRASTQILEGIRDRANAEAQLTADIITEVSKREFRQIESIRSIQTLEAEAYRDFLKEKNDLDEDSVRKVARLQLLAGQSFAENPLIKSLADLSKETKQSPVVDRIDKSNELLTKILNAVDRSGNSTALTSSTETTRSNISTTAKTEKTLRSFIEGQGFNVTRTFGKAINKGSLHPLGLAADISIRNKSKAEQEAVILSLLGEGYRVVDERKAIPGIKQTGPHIHSEINDRRFSTFQKNPDFYSQGFLDKARQLDIDRLGAIKTSQLPKSKQTIPTSSGTIIIVPSLEEVRKMSSSQTTPTQDKQLGNLTISAGTNDTLAQRPRVNTLASAAKSFGLAGSSKEELSTLSEESLDILTKYVEGLEKFKKLKKEEIVGQDRINQLENVNITQKRELIVSEDRLARLRSGDSISTLEALKDAEIARNREAASNLTQIIQKEDYLQKLRAKDPEVIKQLDEKRKNARLDEVTALEIEIKNLEARATQGGRDAELENLQLKRQRLEVINSVGEAESALETQRKLNDDAEFVRARRTASVIEERTDLEARLADIEDERATGDINQALRVRLATEEALLDIHREDLKAQEDIAAAQVRLADSTVYHADQANAKVLEFLANQATITDAISGAKIGVIETAYGFIDRGLTKITAKLGILGDVFKDLFSSIIKLTLNKIFLRLLGLDTAGNKPTQSITGSAVGGASGGGGGISSILSNIFSPGASGGASGGQAPRNATASIFSNALSQSGTNPFAGDSVRNALSPTSISDGTRARIVSGQPVSALGSGGGLLNSIFGAGGLKGLGKSLGGMAPGLGLSLGASLGGSSGIGAILGGIGGLAGGLAVGVGTGAIGAAGTFGAGAIAALGGTLAATGVLAAVAVPLLIGAYLLGRNKKRREEEKQRSAILVDAKGKIQQLIDGVRSGRQDSASAIANATAIRADYLGQVSKLTDKKTRNIAIATVRELDALIDQLKVAGSESDVAAERFKLLVPTFASGGNISYVAGQQGFSSNRENLYIAKRDDEVVLNRDQVASLGGRSAMSRAGVPGYGNSSSGSSLRARSVSFSSSSSASKEAPNQLFVLVADEKVADQIVDQSGSETVAKKMRIHVKKTGLDGIAGDIATEWNR